MGVIHLPPQLGIKKAIRDLTCSDLGLRQLGSRIKFVILQWTSVWLLDYVTTLAEKCSELRAAAECLAIPTRRRARRVYLFFQEKPSRQNVSVTATWKVTAQHSCMNAVISGNVRALVPCAVTHALVPPPPKQVSQWGTDEVIRRIILNSW